MLFLRLTSYFVMSFLLISVIAIFSNDQKDLHIYYAFANAYVDICMQL